MSERGWLTMHDRMIVDQALVHALNLTFTQAHGHPTPHGPKAGGQAPHARGARLEGTPPSVRTRRSKGGRVRERCALASAAASLFLRHSVHPPPPARTPRPRSCLRPWPCCGCLPPRFGGGASASALAHRSPHTCCGHVRVRAPSRRSVTFEQAPSPIACSCRKAPTRSSV
eukprot:COSAG01_NODE_6999_length_3398_cov_4.459836_1_plen_171_part_00